MNSEENIIMRKEIVDKIKSSLNTIKLTTKEKDTKKEVEGLIKLLESETSLSEGSLEEKILEKMKETKSTDPSMNANLYILHRKLINGQISEEQALELFRAYVKTEYFNGLY